MTATEAATDASVDVAPTWTEVSFTKGATLPVHPHWYLWGCCDGRADARSGGTGAAQDGANTTGGTGYIRLRHWDTVSAHPVCIGEMCAGECRRSGRWEATDRTAELRVLGVKVCVALVNDVDSITTLFRLHRQHVNALFAHRGSGGT